MNLNEKHSKTRDRFPLSPKKIWKETLAKMFVWFLGCLVLWLVRDVVAGSIAFIFLIPLTWLYEVAYFNSYFYDMSNDFFVVHDGVFTTHELIIPYDRIQDIYIDQSLLDRLFGLYTVHVSSTTAAAYVDGLTKVDAEGLRNALLDAVRNAKH